jgi:hypothetical protein
LGTTIGFFDRRTASNCDVRTAAVKRQVGRSCVLTGRGSIGDSISRRVTRHDCQRRVIARKWWRASRAPDSDFGLHLTAAQKVDLVEFLKSL